MQSQTASRLSDDSLPSVWEVPRTHDQIRQQGKALQAMFRSSVTPPDTPTRRQNRENFATFLQSVLSHQIIRDQLRSYMWDSYVVYTHSNVGINVGEATKGRYCICQ